ncbi:oligoendopeptidase F [Bacillus sp. H-16]|uniref:oligoendopeptidase F n=1 Tax=Alteribacter salitolerans TaxID=2912333 RepID=UPI00196298B0|nr:oligoendopeptidase F [Alteribacter salitolerans]MBM7094508.1 oligoendopeptidase F [Alteribacter salitolerans]
MEAVKGQKRTRKSVPESQTWDLSDLFSSEKTWKEELNRLNSDISEVTRFSGRLNHSAKTLLMCLQARDAFIERAYKAATYASLKLAEDGSDPVNQGNYAKVYDILAGFDASLSFIDSEVLQFPDGKIGEYLNEEPDLLVYKKNLMDLEDRKEHTLSPETEKVLASLSALHAAPYAIYSQSKSSDMSFDTFLDGNNEEQSLTFASYEDRFELSADPVTRRNAYESFTNGLQKYKNTYAAGYAKEVTKQVTLSKIRGYNSVTEMLLHPQDVSVEMYENQLNIIYKELAPHMQRLMKLKKQQSGLDEIRFCDLKAPLEPSFNPEVTYDEACKMILESLEVMGPEYMDIMKQGLNDRWVDKAENDGKMTGAFCSSPYASHPYILLTWTDMMRGTFILTHELGHAGHFYLANKYQQISNVRPSTYFVEAPSTLNELLLADHLIKKSSEAQMKRWVILQLLGTYYHNFVTHLLEGEFQRRVYTMAENNEALTADSLSAVKLDVLKGFWGDTVSFDDRDALTWMRQPHYYMGLYPYTYSAGLTASTLVAKMIKDEGQPAVDRWLHVLKSGGTMKPLELLSHAGADLSNPAAIREAVSYVGSLVDEVEKSYT